MMGFSCPAEGKRFDGGDDRTALDFCEQLMSKALEIRPIVKIFETNRGRDGQGPLL